MCGWNLVRTVDLPFCWARFAGVLVLISLQCGSGTAMVWIHHVPQNSGKVSWMAPAFRTCWPVLPRCQMDLNGSCPFEAFFKGQPSIAQSTPSDDILDNETESGQQKSPKLCKKHRRGAWRVDGVDVKKKHFHWWFVEQLLVGHMSRKNRKNSLVAKLPRSFAHWSWCENCPTSQVHLTRFNEGFHVIVICAKSRTKSGDRRER